MAAAGASQFANTSSCHFCIILQRITHTCLCPEPNHRVAQRSVVASHNTLIQLFINGLDWDQDRMCCDWVRGGAVGRTSLLLSVTLTVVLPTAHGEALHVNIKVSLPTSPHNWCVNDSGHLSLSSSSGTP